MSFHVPEKYRVTKGDPRITSDVSYGNNGAFLIPIGRASQLLLQVIASDQNGWEHVSVSTPFRAPMWGEMCIVKGLFWDPEDCVVQFHPPESEYVNVHPYCLHLWRGVGIVMPRPPAWMVG